MALSRLIHKLQIQAFEYQPEDEHRRQQLLATSNEIMKTIESPSERIARMIYSDTFLFIAARILTDLDVFRIISTEKSSATVACLAERTGADASLLARLLKHVCTQNFVHEAGPDEYTANAITNKLAYGCPQIQFCLQLSCTD